MVNGQKTQNSLVFISFVQDMMMKSTLDSIFEVGFGVELNATSGVDDFGSRFAKAFDDSNSIVFFRYVDSIWKVKRFLNIGLEASLNQNIKVSDDFVFGLIKCKREQMKNGKLEVSRCVILFILMNIKHYIVQEKIVQEVRQAAGTVCGKNVR